MAENECGSRWLETAEVFCTSEPGHPGEHLSKAEIEYEDGQIGRFEVSWVSDANAGKQK